MSNPEDDHAYNWVEVDAVEEQKKAIQAAQHQRSQAYYHVFANDPMGQKILSEWVTEYCTGQPPSVSASEREVGMMDGKRQLVKMILDQITIATGDNNHE